jgi:hypothetical protein
MKFHEYYVVPRLKDRNEVVEIEEDTDNGSFEDGAYKANKTQKVVYRGTLADCYAFVMLTKGDLIRSK